MPCIERPTHLVVTVLWISLFLIALVGGCKQQSRSGAEEDKDISSGNDQKGYLHSDGDGVMFIRWTEINGTLNGQLSIFYAKGGRGKTGETSSHSFEGVSDGENFSINFTGSIWTDGLGGQTWTGTIRGDELTLVIPVKSGTLESLNFRAETVEEYNQAVLRIRRAVEEENARIEKEQAEAARISAEKSAVIEGNNRVKTSIKALVDSLDVLEDVGKVDDVFESYSDTWEKMKDDYNELRQKAAERPLTSHRLGTVQHVLGMLQHDIGTFGHHSGTLDYKMSRISDAIVAVKERTAILRESWDYLQKAVAANSSGTPISQFSESDVSQPARLAEATIQKAAAKMQDASKRRVSFESQANDLYKQAESFVKTLRAVEQ